MKPKTGLVLVIMNGTILPINLIMAIVSGFNMAPWWYLLTLGAPIAGLLMSVYSTWIDKTNSWYRGPFSDDFERKTTDDDNDPLGLG